MYVCKGCKALDMNKDTRLKDILDQYPQIKERLPDINPKFEMLLSPLGKIMIPKVTLSDVSNRSGMEIDDLISAIQSLINP